MTTLEHLQQWFKSQCDGDWEHGIGIRIESLDNPGWTITIELDGTDLEDVSMERYVNEQNDLNWVRCWIDQKKFRGQGDPSKLELILLQFEQLIRSTP